MVPSDQLLDFGPWWYAPLIATMLGGATLFTQNPGNLFWHGIAGIVAAVAGVITSAHDSRRRATRTGPSTQGMFYLGLIVVMCWVFLAAWGTAVSTLGEARFVPGYAALAWAVTTLALLGVRSVLSNVRRRRAPLQ
jgi:hypothetical protein